MSKETLQSLPAVLPCHMAKLVYNIEPASPSMISALDRHCLTRVPDGSSNIVPARSHLNRILEGDKNGLMQSLRNFYDRGVQKPTAQSEKPYLRIVLSASPEYFRPGDPDAVGTWDEGRLAAWIEASMNQLREEHGADLVFAELHLDEDTPHIHAVVAPTYARKARKPGKAKRGETPDQFEARKAAALASEGVRTVGRASHPTLSKQGSFQRLRERMTIALDHLGIEYGEDRAINAPEGLSTREWVIEQAAQLREEKRQIEQDREKLDRQRAADIADAVERTKLVEKTARLAENARNMMLDTAKAKVAEAKKRAVEAEERVRTADDALQAAKVAQRAAQEAADAILAKAQEEAARIVLRANQSAEADVRAITRARLDDEGKAFMDLTEENRMLKKVVSHQKAMITLIQDTLKQLVPDGLRKQFMSAFNAVWGTHPENLDAIKAPPARSIDSGPPGP